VFDFSSIFQNIFGIYGTLWTFMQQLLSGLLGGLIPQ